MEIPRIVGNKKMYYLNPTFPKNFKQICSYKISLTQAWTCLSSQDFFFFFISCHVNSVLGHDTEGQ